MNLCLKERNHKLNYHLHHLKILHANVDPLISGLLFLLFLVSRLCSFLPHQRLFREGKKPYFLATDVEGFTKRLFFVVGQTLAFSLVNLLADQE